MGDAEPIFRALAVAPATALNPECISCTPPQHDPDIVFFTDGWKVVLHPSQCGAGWGMSCWQPAATFPA